MKPGPGAPADVAQELAALRARVRELEAALRAASAEQARSLTLLETVPAVVMRVSLAGTIEYVNRVLPEYAAAGPDGPVGHRIFTFAPPDQHEVMRAALARTAQTLENASYESQSLAPDGTRDWYLTTVGPILEAGRLVGFALVCANVSRVRAAEDALTDSRARLELALDAGNVGVWRWDRQRDTVEWDEKLTAMFGLAPGQGPRTVSEYLALIPEDQREAMSAHIARALERGTYSDFELRADRPGGPRWFIIKGGLLRDAGGEVTGLLGGVIDVTERRRVDEHLRQAQKLEAVGQLSAGVAHNFNNMLAVILPALELARRELPPEHAQLLDDAALSATNAAQLVRQLMVFARSAPAAGARREPLAEAARRAVDLCRQTFERRVELTLGDLEAARFASVESGPMEQALLNLLLNARDALGESGPAVIDVSARRLAEPEVRRRHAEARGPHVELRVTDTGAGMDEATRRRMFEPFFTTKPHGHGTGLGLSTAWATVEAHRGFLDCDSAPGRGTTFSLLLPVEATPAQTTPAQATPAVMATPRVVLLVDDEEAVRRATARALSAVGYTVLDAASGEEALRLAEASPVDVVVLDYSMPGLSAEETFAGLQRLRPGLPVVCLSGLNVTLAGARVQLLKPVRQAELVAALEAAVLPA